MPGWKRAAHTGQRARWSKVSFTGSRFFNPGASGRAAASLFFKRKDVRYTGGRVIRQRHGQYTPYASESPLSLPFRIGGKRSSQDQTQLHRDRSPMSASIALVDEDRNILPPVSLALQAEGFQPRLYTHGKPTLKAIRKSTTEPTPK